jgi:hypothetical protein
LIARPSTFSSHSSAGSSTPSRASRAAQVCSSSKENALSRLCIGSRWSTAVNMVETAPPTFCVGESGVRSSGILLLERLEATQPQVEVVVVQGRVVEHVVAPACVLDLLGRARVLLPGFRRGGRDVGVGLAADLRDGVGGLTHRQHLAVRHRRHPSQE